ncbi:MAG: hypothetical protein ABIP95_10145 [Pelobium sp.]
MDKKSLKDYLAHHHSKDTTLQLAILTANGEIEFSDILNLCIDPDKQIAFRAAWLLEIAEVMVMDDFKPMVADFLKIYPLVKNESVQRHFTKIMMRLTRSEIQEAYAIQSADLENCLNITFDWLLDIQTPLAVQCNCMDIIYRLSYGRHWILEDLKMILEKKLLSGSPALISRSTRILKKMKSK